MSESMPSDANGDSFPDPVFPPTGVDAARAKRTSRLIKAAGLGIGARALVVVVELCGVWLLGHAVLLVDAVATLCDVVASLAIVAAVKLAERPPDDEHPFGHGRYEPLAGLQLGVVIVLVGCTLAVYQILQTTHAPMAGHVGSWDVSIPLFAAVLLEGCYRAILRIGRKENSSALVAEAYHYRIDAVTSLLAALALALAARAPDYGRLIDHLFALLLVAIMMLLGVLAVRENLHQLLDGAPHDASFDRVRRSANSVDGVMEIEKIRIQSPGPDAHVDIDIEVDPELSVHEAHRIAQHVRARIQTDWPSVREVVVHVEPYFPADH